MEKVPLTQEGLDAKILMLKALPFEDYLHELNNLQHHTKTWCVDNFELTGEQISVIEEAPDALFFLIGLNARIAIEYDQEIELENNDIDENTLRAICKLKVKGGGTYTPSTGEWSGKFTLSIGLP